MRALPLVLCEHPVKPQDTAGRSFATFFYHVIFAGKIRSIQPPPLCFAQQNIGEVSRSDGGVEKIIWG